MHRQRRIIVREMMRLGPIESAIARTHVCARQKTNVYNEIDYTPHHTSPHPQINPRETPHIATRRLRKDRQCSRHNLRAGAKAEAWYLFIHVDASHSLYLSLSLSLSQPPRALRQLLLGGGRGVRLHRRPPPRHHGGRRHRPVGGANLHPLPGRTPHAVLAVAAQVKMESRT